MTPPFALLRRAPSPPLAGLVREIVVYRERGLSPPQRETASLTVPLIINLGTPFRIGLGREPTAADAQPSFGAGVSARPVHILSDGGAECVQVNFTLSGACRLFGGLLAAMADRMVDVGALFGRDGRDLVDRLGATSDWGARCDLVEAFLLPRVGTPPGATVRHALHDLLASGGRRPVAAIADDIGVSRQHLSACVRATLGLPPKAVGRIVRFQSACALAEGGGETGWAAIAVAAGYSDQAHLAREFRAFAGETPSAWAHRRAHLDPRLRRPEPLD
ncbi:helix-turn-helix domain-containing protein [Acuticoccus mangrovi]|uniref:AraC family transcriptional regulator n=1 Tax=Acuticoccus mangrovi TaxID=2796142 RepID=A0A934IPT7_9HYPH|nr:AraC family transcriptional regulator [Acuticoccus mangrovi]MBJ3776510.1 AraC family transcriptional regulator [Acuticoccus mangrovi]